MWIAPVSGTAGRSSLAEAAGFAGPGLVDHEGTSALFRSVDRFDGGFRFRLIVHFDEAEAFDPAGFTVDDQTRIRNSSVLREKLLQLFHQM